MTVQYNSLLNLMNSPQKHHAEGLTGLFESPYTGTENHRFSEVPPTVKPQANRTYLVLPPDHACEELVQLAAHATEYLMCHLAPSTLTVYARAWRGFARWCARYGLAVLPAEVSTIVLYLTWLAEQGRTLSTMKCHLAAIKAHHEKCRYATPTHAPIVKHLLQSICRTHGTPPQGAAALLPEMLRQLVLTMKVDTLVGKRDRALLLIGFAGAFRRSELVGLNVEDLTWHDEGVVICLPRSKTDQHGQGRLIGIPYGKHPTTCPVTALAQWLHAARIEHGAVFHRFDGQIRLTATRLTGRSVSLILKRYATMAGLDAAWYSSHSLRVGHCTAAVRAGVPEPVIMQQTGHRSHQTLRRYLRLGRIFAENSAKVINL